MRAFTKATIGVTAAAGLLLGGGALAANAAAPASAPKAVHAASTSTIPAPVAAIPALTGDNQDTQVTLDSGFVSALQSLGLTPGTVGTATLSNGALDFPITGGSVVYWSPKSGYKPYVQGMIEHDGSGLSLTAGGTTVQLTNFTINPGSSKLYGDVIVNGQTAATQAYLFNLWGGSLKPLQVSGDQAILEGTTVHVSSTAADLLNKTFKTDAVKGGLLVGVAKITVNTGSDQ